MKRLILSVVVVIAASVSHANVVCSVNSGDPKQNMVFDHIIFSSDMSSSHYLIVSKDKRSTQEIQISQFNTFRKWTAIDGQTLVTLSAQQNGQYAITVAQVDLAKMTTDALPLDAMAFGSVTNEQSLNLIVPPKNLSIICSTLK